MTRWSPEGTATRLAFPGVKPDNALPLTVHSAHSAVPAPHDPHDPPPRQADTLLTPHLPWGPGRHWRRAAVPATFPHRPRPSTLGARGSDALARRGRVGGCVQEARHRGETGEGRGATGTDGRVARANESREAARSGALRASRERRGGGLPPRVPRGRSQASGPRLRGSPRPRARGPAGGARAQVERGKALPEPAPLAPERRPRPLSPAPPAGPRRPSLHGGGKPRWAAGRGAGERGGARAPPHPAAGAAPAGASGGSQTFSATLRGATRQAHALPPGGWACGCARRDWPSGRLAIG